MATNRNTTKITATQSHTEQRNKAIKGNNTTKHIKRYKISSKDCEAIEALNQPYCDHYDVYLYLQDRGEINLSRTTHIRVMTSDDKDLTRLEQRYKYAVSDLITRTNYRVYQELYKQALDNPSMLVDYLKIYDRREREQVAQAKAYRSKSSKTDNNKIDYDRQIVARNLDQLYTLMTTPQPPNKINIPTPSTDN